MPADVSVPDAAQALLDAIDAHYSLMAGDFTDEQLAASRQRRRATSDALRAALAAAPPTPDGPCAQCRHQSDDHTPDGCQWTDREPSGTAIYCICQRFQAAAAPPTPSDEDKRFDLAVDILLNSGLLAPHTDDLFAFVDGEIDEDEARRRLPA